MSNLAKESDPKTTSVTSFLDHNTVEYLLYCIPNYSLHSSTILIIVSHVRKFLPYLDEDDPFIDTVRRLHDIASQRKVVNFNIYRRNKFEAQKLEGIEAYMKQEVERIFISSFVPEVRRFFIFSEALHVFGKDSPGERNEIMAGFIVFLIQILDSESTSWYSNQNQKCKILQENLTFLLTIIGDTPFLSGHLYLSGLLVDQAGELIYFRVLESGEDRNENIDKVMFYLMKEFDTFRNEMLKNHYFELTESPESETAASLDSLFTIDSLIEDLKGLMNGQFGLITDDFDMYHIKAIVEELISIQAYTEYILMPQGTPIRKLVSETGYLINTLVTGHIPPWYLNLRLPGIVKKVKFGFEHFKKMYDVKGIDINKIGVSFEAVRSPKVEVESMMIGFENCIKNIFDDLLGGSQRLRTISIYGMPGIGKTTIAKMLYNDPVVYNHFDVRVWCVVSQKYDRKKVLTDILVSLENNSVKDKILQFEEVCLGFDIYEGLCGKRYLIFLDDVWNSETWNGVGKFFPDFGNGSRIILTSQIKNAAPLDSIFHTPPLLSESQCFDLLLKKVFIQQPCPPELFGIAKGIASKCCGLPLAVMVVAGIMANIGKEESTWKKVEANLKSSLFDDQRMKIFELSYEYLSDHLKPCFLYLGRFREEEEILVRKLTKLWIAEGFVHGKEDNNLEHVAEGHLLELVNRSLLMITKRKSDGGVKACGIHDLVREMCLRKAEEAKFLKHIYEYSSPSIYERYSHLVVHTTAIETVAALHCHSLTGYLSSLVYQVKQMPLLRVIDELQLESSSFLYEIERICSLVHLKYLSFSVREFPVGLCKLVNLEYFHLNAQCKVSVPSAILKMVKLRHVCITTEAIFEKSWDDSLSTNNIESLSYVLVRNEEECEILKCSPRLRKLKCVGDKFFFPDLSYLTELESLTMKFIRPPYGELTWRHFPLTIKKLSLYRTGLPWEKMTIVGSLPNLCVLKLLCCAFVGEEWEMEDEVFQNLRYLKLSDVSLQAWHPGCENFPSLECLVLEFVMDLEHIPLDIGEIASLQTIEVRHCGYGIERSVLEIEREQMDIGNYSLKIIITRDVKWPKDELIRHIEQEKIDKEELSIQDVKDASEIGFESRDVDLVMTQAWVSRARAVKALKDANGNIVKAIMQLT